MTSSIQLFDAAFGHVSILNVVSDLVTHAHEDVHIIMWLAGDGGEMTVGNERIVPGRRIAVGVNSLEPHRHYFPAGGSEGKFLAFYIDPDWVAARRSGAREDRIFTRSAIRIDNRLNDLAFALLAALTDSDTPGHLAEYETERFIDTVFETALAQRHRRDAHARATARDYRVRKAAALMKTHMCERTCLDEVARSVGLSRPHFFALFKEQMGLTPNVYWNSMRMAEAARQLRASRAASDRHSQRAGLLDPGEFFSLLPRPFRRAADDATAPPRASLHP